jgi:hypothetical protein
VDFEGREGAGFIHYARKSRSDDSNMLEISDKEGKGPLTWRELRTQEDMSIKLFQQTGPRSENAASVITKINFRGLSQLLMADANSSVLESMLNHKDQLRSTVLKWPHHVWVPKTGKDIEIAKEFLRAVKPSVVLVSNIGAATHRENFKTLMHLIYSTLGPGVSVKWTAESGSFDFVSHNFAKSLTADWPDGTRDMDQIDVNTGNPVRNPSQIRIAP